LIHHLVLIQLIDSATEADRRAIFDGMQELLASIPNIRSLVCTEVLGPENSSWNLALRGTFETMDDYRTYSTHPIHRQYATDVLKPLMSSATSVQFEGA
jgi:hypothetical protein